MGNRLAASPKKEVVNRSLTALYDSSKKIKSRRIKVLNTDLLTDRFIIFSDQHKGNRSWADDFASSEKNYISALSYYNRNEYTFINLGDSEELWKFTPQQILPANKEAFAQDSESTRKRLQPKDSK